jgi:hypothetical protein
VVLKQGDDAFEGKKVGGGGGGGSHGLSVPSNALAPPGPPLVAGILPVTQQWELERESRQATTT